MPDRIKYTLRMALVPQNAVEGVTYMPLEAVVAEIKKARDAYEDARFDFINEDDSTVTVLCRAADVQIIMHFPWKKPVQNQVLPATLVPRPQIVQ